MKHLILVLVAIAVVALQSNASAAIVTSNGTIHMMDTGGPGGPNGPPLPGIHTLSLDTTFLFTNQVSSGPGFAVGETIRTVGLQRVSAAINGNQSPAALEGPAGLQPALVLLFALEGRVKTNVAGVAEVGFTLGRAFATFETAALDLDNPSTWNLAGAFAEFALIPQESVLPGPIVGPAHGAQFGPVASSDTNESAANLLNTSFADGILLFAEDSSLAQNLGGAGPFAPAGTGGDNFISDVAGNPLNIRGPDLLVSTPQQSLQFAVTATNSGLLPADLAALNAIATAAGLPFFATGIGAGPSTNWDPDFVPAGVDGDGVSGDFRAEVKGSIYLAAVVPEPTSVLVFGGLFGVSILYTAVQKRRRSN